MVKRAHSQGSFFLLQKTTTKKPGFLGVLESRIDGLMEVSEGKIDRTEVSSEVLVSSVIACSQEAKYLSRQEICFDFRFRYCLWLNAKD